VRVVLVVVAILLTGCAGGPTPRDGADPTQALYTGGVLADATPFGPEANRSSNGDVFGAQCGATNNVAAFTLNATEPNGVHPASIAVSTPLGVPNATRFMITAFVPTDAGLVLAYQRLGGSATTYADVQGSPFSLLKQMPTSLSLPVGRDGFVRLVIACEGPGHVHFVTGNYDVGADGPSRPRYVEPVTATGFDIGLGAIWANIYLSIPPTATTNVIKTTLGNMQVSRSNGDSPGIHRGETTIEWVGGPGWSRIDCEHYGLAEHGRFAFSSQLHGDTMEGDILMADGIATLGLAQQLTFGQTAVTHTSEGSEGATLRMTVTHEASADYAWASTCSAIHLGAPLEGLLGMAAAPIRDAGRSPLGLIGSR
jgi:hypothetical protein